MATPLDFYKITTMVDGGPNVAQTQKYYSQGCYELVWPIFMVGGKLAPWSEAFLIPWVSIAGVYLDPRGLM